MISKILDRIQEDLDFIKEIATEENFKRLEEKCDFVNTRNKELQQRINKAIEYIEEATKYPRGMGLEPLDEIYADNIVDILKGE